MGEEFLGEGFLGERFLGVILVTLLGARDAVRV